MTVGSLHFTHTRGGVGRTMALANIAWILASMGKKVLVIDWDLESPGLHRYFHPFLSDEDLRSHEGILDLIVKYADATLQSDGSVDRLSELAQAQSCAVSLEWDFPSGGILDFVSAGRQDESYSIRVSTFDWDSFWGRLGGGSFLDALARDMRRNYDFVLIDSRTGLSDTAGICIVQLPDVVVCCFSMNRQSIDGSVAVAASIRHLGVRPIRLLPVLMMVDEDDVCQLKGNPGSYIRQRFDRLVSDSGSDDVDSYWTSAAIPYTVDAVPQDLTKSAIIPCQYVLHMQDGRQQLWSHSALLSTTPTRTSSTSQSHPPA